MTTAVSDASKLGRAVLDARRLEAALTEVLEAMFFCPPEEVAVSPGPGPWDRFDATECQSSQLNFRGPVDGAFALVCSKHLARCLAESFHGETPSAGEVGEVLLELSNVVCGNHLSQLDAGSVFALDTPRPWDRADWMDFAATFAGPALEHRTRLAVRTEEGWIAAWIEIAA
jgi:hypothetical protein